MNEQIRYPVSFEPIQSSIEAIKNALKNIKPEATLYKSMSTALTKIEGQAEQLRTILSNPIKDKAALNSAQKKYADLITNIEVQAGKLQSVSFNEIALKDNDLKTYQDLVQSINEIGIKLKEINTSKLKELKAELKADPTKADLISNLKIDNSSSFKDLNKKIDVELDKVDKRIQESRNEIDKYNTAVVMINQLDPDDANSVVKNSNGKISFKSGQRDIFLSQLSDLGINASSARDAQTKLEDFRNNFSEPEVNKQLQQLYEYKNQIEELRQLMQTKFNPDMGTDDLHKKLEDLRKDLDDFKASLVNSARTAGNAVNENVGRNLTNALNNSRDAANNANATFDNLAETTQKLNRVAFLVKRFVSWGTALRWCVKEVKQMISSIQSLDKVITSIAVVTNMTQEQLWQQMDSYTTIAQRYGASIEGTYQVSQIFYQQGVLNI